MITFEIIFAILLAIAVLAFLLDKTTPSDEACLTALKATAYAILALPVAMWMFASTVIARAKRKFSAHHPHFSDSSGK
jgi:hypothetical protein